MDVKMHWQDTHKSRMITKQTMWRVFFIARSYNDNGVSNVISLVLSYILQTPILGLTQEWFRTVSFSRLACGVYDTLHIYPCGIVYFLCILNRHRIEGTNMLYSVSSKRHMQSKLTSPSFE